MRSALLGLFLVLTHLTQAQLTWQYAFGGFSTDVGRCVLATSDLNYVVVGSTGSFGAGGGDIYVMMLEEDGSRFWSTTLGGPGVEQGRAVIEVGPSEFLVAGSTTSTGAGGYDGYVAKLDNAGGVLWERTYGGTGWDFIHDVIEVEGGFLLAGQSFSGTENDGDAWVVRIDGNGLLLWELKYGGVGEDLGNAITKDPAGGFILAGATTQVDMDAWLVSCTDDGDVVWENTFGGTGADVLSSVIPTSDGGIAAVGSTESFSEFLEAYHIKTDASGDLVWQRNWGQVNDQVSYDVKELADGRFASAGYVASGGSGGLDMFIFFTESDGDFAAGITNGGDNGANDEVGYSIDLAADGGLVLCGYTKSFGSGPQDVYVVKTDEVGLTESIAVVESFDPLSIWSLPVTPTSPPSPNPATTFTQLQGAGPWTMVHLTDAQGRMVRRWERPVAGRLDLQGLEPGRYQLVTFGEDGRQHAALIIAQH